MHHTRKTHNAHNETQRRLRKILNKGYVSDLFGNPHYTFVDYRYGRYGVHPDWAPTRYSNTVFINTRGNCKIFDSFEEMEFAKKRFFLMKKSKSSGRHSVFGFYKRLLHKRWRRKSFDEQSYRVKGSCISYNEIAN